MTKLGSVMGFSWGVLIVPRLSSRTLTNSVSSETAGLSLRHAFALAPFLQQGVAPTRIALIVDGERRDAVGAEVAKVVAQLAPRGDDTHTLEETERERPDRPSRLLLNEIEIRDGDLALRADRVADRHQFGVSCGERFDGPDHQRRRVDRM